MATVYISEYYFLTQLPGDAGQMPMEPPQHESVLPIGAAVESLALNSGTRFVRINVDSPCSILFGIGRGGAIPTPALDITTGNQRFARDQTEFKGVPNGDGVTVKIAAIANV
jgi:hypothetical protein